MVVNERALVREMKAAYKVSGYGVAVRSDGTWVITAEGWAVVIEGVGNVPREALSLMVLHMGFLPHHGDAWRVYKTDNGPQAQKQVFEVALESVRKIENLAARSAGDPEWVYPTHLRLGADRIWQNPKTLEVVPVDPRHSSLMAETKEVRRCGDCICLEGSISWVYIAKSAEGASGVQLDHLEKMQWVEE